MCKFIAVNFTVKLLKNKKSSEKIGALKVESFVNYLIINFFVATLSPSIIFII